LCGSIDPVDLVPPGAAATRPKWSRACVDEGIVCCWTGTGEHTADKVPERCAAMLKRHGAVWNHAACGAGLRATSLPRERSSTRGLARH
jgi:hypothetical protein